MDTSHLKKNLLALRDDVIVGKLYKYDGKISIPDAATEYKKYHGVVECEVISVGDKYPYNVNPGDIVLVRRHEGKRIEIDGQEYYCVKNKWVEGKK